MKTTDTKHRFIELRAKGHSLEKISSEIGTAKRTLIEWSKDFEEEIANHKAVELEALYEKHYLLKEHRIQLFGGILSKIHEELSRRDLSTVGTTQLMDMMLKFSNHLKYEFTESALKSSTQIEAEKSNRQMLEAIG